MKQQPTPSADIILGEELAKRLFPTEWQSALNATSDRGRRRYSLRNRAWDILLTARKMGEEKPHKFHPAQRPSNVRMANQDDLDGLFALLSEEDEEPIVARDLDKIREVISFALDKDDVRDLDGAPAMRPIFGVVAPSGTIEGACGIFPTQPWDSDAFFLRGFCLRVGVQYRRSSHAKDLVNFANWFSGVAGMPLVWELLCRRLGDRDNFFMRHARPVGGLFVYNAQNAA